MREEDERRWVEVTKTMADCRRSIFMHLCCCLIVSLGLALVVLALPADAFAEPVGTLTVSSNYDHALTAYRLLSGTASGDTLSGPSFKGAMESSFYDGLAGLRHWSAADDSRDPVAVREWLSASIDEDSDYSLAQHIAALAQESGSRSVALRTNEPTALAEGYWLVTGDETLPFCVLVGTASVTAHEKASVPTSEKGVSTDGGSAGYHESAVAGAGTRLSFRVRGTLPANYGSYGSYLYRFVDTASDGIEVDASSVRVVVSLPGGSSKDITDSFAIDYADHTLTVSTDDLKSAYPTATGDEHVDLLYEATLDPAKAGLGYAHPNTNSAKIIYSNNPATDGRGTTEPSRTKIFSFGLNVHKVDSSNQAPLRGAEFVVRDDKGRYLTDEGVWSHERADAAVLKTGPDGCLSVGCLGPGSYEVTETKAPKGYSALRGAVEVDLSADQDEGALTVYTNSAAASVSEVDAEKGTATLTIENSASGTPIGFGGLLPQTGDAMLGATAVLALLAASAILLRLSGRLRRQH